MKAFDDFVLFAGVMVVLSMFGLEFMLTIGVIVVLFAISWDSNQV